MRHITTHKLSVIHLKLLPFLPLSPMLTIVIAFKSNIFIHLGIEHEAALKNGIGLATMKILKFH